VAAGPEPALADIGDGGGWLTGEETRRPWHGDALVWLGFDLIWLAGVPSTQHDNPQQ